MNFHFLNGRNNTASIQQDTLLACTYCDQNESQRRNQSTKETTTKLTQNTSIQLYQIPCKQTLNKWQKKKKELKIHQKKQQIITENILKLLATYLCLREIYGLSSAELLYSNAVSQPKHQLGKHFQPASPQPASDNIKIHEKKNPKISSTQKRFQREQRAQHTCIYRNEKPNPIQRFGNLPSYCGVNLRISVGRVS